LQRTEIFKLYEEKKLYLKKNLTICGWIRTIRDSKKLGFIEINDGSCFKSLQIVFEEEKICNFKEITKLNVGAAIVVHGLLVETPNAKQPFEIHASAIEIQGHSSPEYPLQKKRHSLEYLRTIAHLRPRTNTFNAAFRLRSAAAFGIHKFFRDSGFIYVHTPIITGSDCEGAGEMFTVTALDFMNIPLEEQRVDQSLLEKQNAIPNLQSVEKCVDFSQDFFEKRTSLTVSGQLEAECMALAFGKVYTFGPTFRAERSYTTRHAAEFWMVEPEIAFADLQDDMNLATDMVKSVVHYVLENCKPDLEFFAKFYDSKLIERLEGLLSSEFEVITYTDAIDILTKSNDKFDHKAVWGSDLQTEHEKYLTEQVFQKPLFVINYPKEIKSFYMRQNDDGKTVAAMDMLVPGIGELIGGSQREERLDLLEKQMGNLGLDKRDYWWYLDLRRYGSTAHAGFGLGFERLIMYLTGLSNIRDVLPFPRTTGTADF
jgi:asparaginyl-tRNA synthetase